MKKYNLNIGFFGENIAKQYLENKGYKIIEQNCRNKYGEIDLVAENKRTLVFVEVRTKTAEQFGTPEESLNKNKIQKLIKNAQFYLIRKGLTSHQYRIDAVCLVLGKKSQVQRLNHYENITT